MPWHEVQTNFAAALLDPRRAVPAGCSVRPGADVEQRYGIYRNNVTVSLTEAVIDAFPVVARLVGDEFATAMAREFIRLHPPRSPVLIDFGSGYADFIERFGPARSLPYLADVARLEWAWSRAYHAADVIPLPPSHLAGIEERLLPRLRLHLLPSFRLVGSPYPIVSIWAAHQSAAASTGLESLEWQSEQALVLRPGRDVQVRTLSAGLFGFFLAVQRGQPLMEALTEASESAGFDPASAIAALFDTQAVASIEFAFNSHDEDEIKP